MFKLHTEASEGSKHALRDAERPAACCATWGLSPLLPLWPFVVARVGAGWDFEAPQA